MHSATASLVQLGLRTGRRFKDIKTLSTHRSGSQLTITPPRVLAGDTQKGAKFMHVHRASHVAELDLRWTKKKQEKKKCSSGVEHHFPVNPICLPWSRRRISDTFACVCVCVWVGWVATWKTSSLGWRIEHNFLKAFEWWNIDDSERTHAVPGPGYGDGVFIGLLGCKENGRRIGSWIEYISVFCSLSWAL